MIVTARRRPSRCAAPTITVVDTIGAGDAFGGGFLAYWRLRGLDRDALGDADAVRAATTLRLRRRRPHVRAAGGVAAAAVRPRRRPLSRRASALRAAGIRSTVAAITMPTATAPAAISNPRW